MDSLRTYSQQLSSELLTFLWRQWSSIGVGGHAEASDHWIIDPEALLLFSTTITRHDPRLFDEIIDWLQLNGHRMHIQRLTRMHTKHKLGDAAVLAAIGSFLSQSSQHHKWKALKKLHSFPSTSAPASLFPQNSDGANNAVWQDFETDPHFAEHGLLRSPLQLRGLSTEPRPHQPTNLLFKLRSLFGVNTRAESIAWLLGHDQGHPAEIAREIGYFNRSIQLTLNEMSHSGHLRSFRKGREKVFSLYPGDWQFLLKGQANQEPSFPQWIHWAPLFSALQQVHSLLSQSNLDQKSIPIQAIKIRQVLESITPDLAAAKLLHHCQATPDLTGSALIEQTLGDIRNLLYSIFKTSQEND